MSQLSQDFIAKVIEDFYNHILKEGIENCYKKLDLFIKSYHEQYLALKTKEFLWLWKNQADVMNSARQSWRPVVWDVLVKLIEIGVEELATQHAVKITYDKYIKSTKNLSKELTLVRNAMLIHYNEYSFLPDGDIVLYRFDETNVQILCIISFKTSFRERFTETPYWKLKLMENPVTEWIKVIMVTTDNDDEIWFITSKQWPRKARVVMEYELDGIFIANDRFEQTEKVSDIVALFSFLSSLFTV